MSYQKRDFAKSKNDSTMPAQTTVGLLTTFFMWTDKFGNFHP
ncbi:MAG TPA: hypothetical protein PLM81_08485 [Ginsengibacter sp.]|nr:hypothetical protein [Ginsengibacter sp.]HRP44006.1 hypothetical protein [Ginsengibacter sp.]